MFCSNEPTNHLDLEMRLALSMALQEFEGAMMIVSHDRHMLKMVTDTLLLVDSGRADEFDGDLDDYALWLQNRFKKTIGSAASSGSVVAVQSDTDSANTAVNRKEQRRDAAEKRKRLQPLKKQVDQLEKKMDQLNQRKEQLESELADADIYADANKDKLKRLLLEQGELENQLETVEADWMEAGEEYERLLEL